jgi:hypothetical protein
MLQCVTRLVAKLWLCVVGSCICAMPVMAQPPKQATGSQPSASSSGALPGLNFPYSTLQRFTAPPDDKDDVFLCYNLVPVISTNAPFSLQSVNRIEGALYRDSKRHKDRTEITCQLVDADHPLKSRQRIVLALDTHLVDLDPRRTRLRSLNANVTFTQGSTISQRAVRPSISASIQAANLSVEHIYYFVVTDRIAGDAIPQLSVSLLYDPPAPGQHWAPMTIYPPESIVFGPKGHFWQTQLGGVSSPNTDGGWKPMLAEDIQDPVAGNPPNACHWAPYGTSPPTAQTPSLPWTGNNQYAVNNVVFSPSDGLFYLETAAPRGAAADSGKCTSGAQSPFPQAISPYKEVGEGYKTDEVANVAVQWIYVKDNCDPTATPAWAINKLYPTGVEICQPGTPTRLYRSTLAGWSELDDSLTFKNPANTEPNSPMVTTEFTGQVEWNYLQEGCKSPRSQHAVTEKWQGNHYYKESDEICESGKLYQVTSEGRSASQKPTLQNPQTQPGLPEWADIGIYPPSAVTSASPNEIMTNAISIPLAQVHTLAYYNVDTGVFVSTIRIPSFAYTTPTTINNGTPIQTGSTLLVDPVVTMTRYIWGFDSESREHATDWKPGISLSFSLSSPTSNFYVGGSSEIIRYIQINYGFAIAKVPRLSPGAFAPTSSTTPATFQVFAKGGYGGLTFNLSDFVKSLVKGGS